MHLLPLLYVDVSEFYEFNIILILLFYPSFPLKITLHDKAKLKYFATAAIDMNLKKKNPELLLL